jgi:hypothetical protein
VALRVRTGLAALCEERGTAQIAVSTGFPDLSYRG